MAPSQSEETYSEPQWSKIRDTHLPWWRDNIDKYLDENMQNLLMNYSNIPKAQQSAHVHRIRDQAWAIRTYPCIGLGVHLQPYIRFSPAYSEILGKMKEGAIMLDVGCLLGGDLRQLAFDGAPTNNMIGIDIVSFWDVGKEMFRDPSFEGRYVQCDVLKLDDFAELAEMKGKLDIVSISAVLHQWNWDQQVAAAKQVVSFSKVGTLVVGYQIGNAEGKEIEMQMGPMKVKAFKQSPETFAKLWKEVGEQTRTSWRTEASIRTFESIGWDPKDKAWLQPGDDVLDFVVSRLE